MSQFRKEYRPLGIDEKRAVDEIKDRAEALAQAVNAAYTGISVGSQLRYKALAMTALEESVMWSTKGITT